MNNENIFNIYKPIYIFAKYTGFCTNTIRIFHDKIYIKYNRKYSIITSVFHTISAIYFIWCSINAAQLLSTQSPLINLCRVIATLLKFFHYYISVAMENLRSKGIIRIFTDLNEIDKEFRKLGVKLPYVSLRRSCIIVLLTLLLINTYTVFIFLFDKYTKNSYLKIIWCICEMQLYLSQIVSTANFFFIVSIIKQMLANANEILLRVAQRVYISRRNQQLLFRKLMRIHQELIDTMRRYNKRTSLQILFIISMQIAYITLQSFAFVQRLISNNYKVSVSYFVHMGAIFTFVAIKVGVFVIVSNRCQLEVRKIIISSRISYRIIVILRPFSYVFVR